MPPEDSDAAPGRRADALRRGPDGPDLLLTERAHDMRSHPGQVSFPGGSIDPDDDRRSQAALREAEEETGLDPAGVEVFADAARAVAAAEQLRGHPGARLVARAEPGRRGRRPTRSTRCYRVPLEELLDPEHRVTVVHPMRLDRARAS